MKVAGYGQEHFVNSSEQLQGNQLEWVLPPVSKAMLSVGEHGLVEDDLGISSAYFEKRYGFKLKVELEPDWRYLVITNFPLPKSFLKPWIPVLVPLTSLPGKPPPGLYIPILGPDTPRLATFNGSWPPSFYRTQDLARNCWFWLDISTRTAIGNGVDSGHQPTNCEPNWLTSLLVGFDRNNHNWIAI